MTLDPPPAPIDPVTRGVTEKDLVLACAVLWPHKSLEYMRHHWAAAFHMPHIEAGAACIAALRATERKLLEDARAELTALPEGDCESCAVLRETLLGLLTKLEARA